MLMDQGGSSLCWSRRGAWRLLLAPAWLRRGGGASPWQGRGALSWRVGVACGVVDPFDKRAAVMAHALAAEGAGLARPAGGGGAEAAPTPGAAMVMPATFAGAQASATDRPTARASTPW